jgi:hypothetical protein
MRGEKRVPQGCAVMLGDMFRMEGVPVHYSFHDNDDTLAAYAVRDGALVLSGDRDFFRYTGNVLILQIYFRYTGNVLIPS